MRPTLALQCADTEIGPDGICIPSTVKSWILTPAQIGLVRATFQILATNRDRLAEMFYARAIALDPQIRRPQLVSNMVTQRLQLLLALTDIVQQLDDLSRLTQTVAALARQYGLYGAGDPRFQTARAALAWSVERILEPGPDSAIQVAWGRAFDLVEGLLAGSVPLGRASAG